jgi:hypothetical protein
VYYSSTDSLLTYRYRPDSATSSIPYLPTVLDAPIYDVTIDGPPTPVAALPSGGVALVRYRLAADWPPTVDSGAQVTERLGPLDRWDGRHVAVLAGASSGTTVRLLSPLVFDYTVGDPPITVDTGGVNRELILNVPLEAGDVITGTGNLDTYYYGNLRDPQGTWVTRVFGTLSTYEADADGTYTFHATTHGVVQASLGVEHAEKIDFPTDTPTDFVIDRPYRTVYARGTAPPGTQVQLQLVAADASLEDLWIVGLSSDPTFWGALQAGGTSQTFTVGASGSYLVVADANSGKTGTLTLQQHVVSTP